MSSPMHLIQTFAIWALPVLFAITLHEVAHGRVARVLGDDTAARMGRLSLNPLKHVDPVGTILVPALLLALGGFIFGWAKPVPVLMHRLGHPRRDMAIVAAAGPLSNLAMAFLWGLLLKLALTMGGGEGLWLGLRYMATAGIVINLVLMVLNLLPLPPLDGGRVLNGVLPEAWARQVDRIEPYGLFVIVLLMATGWLGRMMAPLLSVAESLVLGALGISGAGLF
ncbi:MAG: site-2 protease family protein [Gammaproteobacteria bacterium]|nr:site-2 protease family protein [Gammaproteobacteria bacterium]